MVCDASQSRILTPSRASWLYLKMPRRSSLPRTKTPSSSVYSLIPSCKLPISCCITQHMSLLVKTKRNTWSSRGS
jgi:hypothetical protein